MDIGFDFTTIDVLDWEIQAIFDAIDDNSLIFTRHAENEMRLDALEREHVLDAIAFFDFAEKDLPNNALDRVPGINFHQELEDKRILKVKVGWSTKHGYYLIITVMANQGRI